MARRWETVQIAALLAVLLAVFFGQALFAGRKLVPADIAYTDPVYMTHAPAEFATPHNVLLYDQAYQFYPWRLYATQALRQGTVPLWNPYIYCGAPFMAEDQPAVLYPLNILSYILPPANAVLLTAIMRLLVAGLATYWFVRTIGGDRLAAVVSAVTFTFSGFLIVWLGHPHTNVAVWLPALFLTAEWLYRRTSPLHVALVALTVALALTGGHAETALYVLAAGGIYYLFRLMTAWLRERDWRLAGARLLAFVGAGALGAALAAAHLLPFLEWLVHSAELQFRAGAGGLRATRLGPTYWVAGLLPALLPNIFNNPTWPGEYRSFLPGWNFVEQTLYAGVVGLALAISAVIARRRDTKVWFWALLALGTLGAALRLPLLDWVNHLPLFSIAAYGRFRLVYTFSIAVLAGFGAQLVLNDQSDTAYRAALIFLIAEGAIGLVLLAVTPRVLMALESRSALPALRDLSPTALPSAFRLTNLAMSWPLFVALLGALILALRHRQGWVSQTGSRLLASLNLRAILVILIAADLFVLGMGYHTTMSDEWVFPRTPAIAMLTRDRSLFRIVGTHIDLMPNTCMVYGLQDVRGLAFPGDRYKELCLAMGGEDWLGYGILFTEPLEPRLLGLMNVKYIITTSRLEPEQLQHLRQISTDNNVTIYENLSCLPRAFVVYRAQVRQHPEAVLPALLDPAFELEREIVLEKDPPHDWLPNLERVTTPTAAMAAEAVVEITHYEPNSVQIRVETPAAGFLFLSDTFYPGWTASVDGVQAEIYRADYAFRAVYLTAGSHQVEFAYRPASFRWGVSISLLALAATVAILSRPSPRWTSPPEEQKQANGKTDER
jgi:hypothetical protein